MMTDAEILSERRFQKNNLEMHELITKAKQGEYQLKFIQYLFLTKNKYGVLTYSGESEGQFEIFKETGRKIMDSFEMK